MIKEINKEKNMGTFFCTLFLCFLVAFQCCVISSFSENTAEVSTEKSNIIVEKVVEVVEKVSQNKTDATFFDRVEFFVRKLAHFVNFFILGFLCSLLSIKINNKSIKAVFLAAALSGAMCAVVDETHQLFVPGRSGEVRDVCVDFSGTLFGCVSFMVMKVICCAEWNKENEIN